MKTKINLILVLALLSVSTSSIIARFLPDVSAVVISFWRLAFAAFFVWIYTAFYRQIRIDKKNYKLYVFSGLFLALHFTCFYAAVKLTSIANATLLGITAPMFTILFERLILKRKLNPSILIGLVFALCGTIIIASSGFVLNDSSLLGKLFGMSAALFIALVYILADKLRVDSNTIAYTRLLYTIAAFFLLIISVLSGESIFAIHSIDLVWLAALGIVPTILGHSLFYYAIKYTSPTIIASVPLGEPIIASILAWLFFLEKVPIITLAGGILILFGVYFIIANSSRATLTENS